MFKPILYPEFTGAAEGWARTTEDEIVRGVYIQRSDSEKLLISAALKRYLNEVTPTKKLTTQEGDKVVAKRLSAHYWRLVAPNRVLLMSR